LKHPLRIVSSCRLAYKALTTSRYISQLLLQKDCVIIPGLGGFVANYKGAFLNPATHTFSPPARRIAFNASLNTNDGLLAHTIARAEQVSYDKALEQVQTYVEELRHRLESGEEVVLEKVGSLRFDADKRIHFDPLLSENYLLDSFGLTPIHSPAIRREQENAQVHNLKKQPERSRRQFWRLAELIPAAAVLALLAFNPKVISTLNATLAQIIPVSGIQYSSVPDYKSTDITLADSQKEETQTPAIPEVIIAAPDSGLSAAGQSEISHEETVSAVEAAEPAKEVTPVVNSNPVKSVLPVAGQMHIIAGCFRQEENAIRRVNDAELAGFSARLIGQNEQGLYMVSIASSSDPGEIAKTLSEVKGTFEPQAWVLAR
jgi:hypothetical protein